MIIGPDRVLLEDRVGIVQTVRPFEGDPSRPRAVTIRSFAGVWSISPFTPAMIIASPSALPCASIMS